MSDGFDYLTWGEVKDYIAQGYLPQVTVRLDERNRFKVAFDPSEIAKREDWTDDDEVVDAILHMDTAFGPSVLFLNGV